MIIKLRISREPYEDIWGGFWKCTVDMLRGACVLIFILSISPENLHAQETNSFSDHAIAVTLKTMATAFLQTVDFEKLKAKHIKTLSKMDEKKFRKHYSKVYDVLKDVPLGLRLRYGVTVNMTQKEAIRRMQRLKKIDVQQIIDALPDEAIAKHVKAYLKQMSSTSKDQNFLQPLDSLWKKMTQKA